MTLNDLANLIGATVRGDGSIEVAGIATLEKAGPEQVGFLANAKYKSQLQTTRAGAVILNAEHDDATYLPAALITDNPYLAYARAAQALDNSPKQAQGIHPTAVISASAQLGDGVCVGAHAVIGDSVILGAGVVIGPNCSIGEGAQIGEQTRLFAGVHIYHRVVIGARCVLHSGVVVGSDGFGWANDRGTWVKIPQLGSVIVGDDVEIGANTTIDRGALDDTVIGSNCIIDNLCLIAHNVQIGEGTALAGQTGIAGSAKLGKGCLVGGQTAINGHITIGDRVQIHGVTMVTKDLPESGVYASALPVVDQATWAKSGARVRQLPELFLRVKAIERKLDMPKKS